MDDKKYLITYTHSSLEMVLLDIEDVSGSDEEYLRSYYASDADYMRAKNEYEEKQRIRKLEDQKKTNADQAKWAEAKQKSDERMAIVDEITSIVNVSNDNEDREYRASKDRQAKCRKDIIPSLREMDAKRSDFKKKIFASKPHVIVRARKYIWSICLIMLITMIVVLTTTKHKPLQIAISSSFGISCVLVIINHIIGLKKEHRRKSLTNEYQNKVVSITQQMSNMSDDCRHL